ncbi:MAG: DUF5011 domain-containing protein, partial [Candidatus Methanoperedens sp.]|nr:DUF5011 domain-containing protein [Candidatus Methanoperedens sp.]
YSINDTTNFAINSGTGLITNATELSAGTYGLNITASDTVGNSVSQIITISVQAEPTYSVSGYVFDNYNAVLAGVNVQNSTHSATSSGSGYYIISGLVNGSYNFSYSKDGYNTDYSIITIDGSDVTNGNKTIFDTIPPGQVTGLVNDTPTQTTVNLSWNPTANASHYQIFRNSSLRGTTQNTYWNDTGLTQATTYQYWVRANDSYNNWGLNSTTLDVTTASTSDTTPPVITLVGTSPITIEINSIYTDAGATAWDNKDGDLTGSIVTVNSVINTSAGTYTVTYNVNDSSNNPAIEKIRIVNVVDPSSLPPVRYINGTVKSSGVGIGGVTVSTNTTVSTTTNATGFYSLAVNSGTFELTATLNPTHYTNSSVTVLTRLFAEVVQDIDLLEKPKGTITGSVNTG